MGSGVLTVEQISWVQKTCAAFPDILEALKQQLLALGRVKPGDENSYLQGMASLTSDKDELTNALETAFVGMESGDNVDPSLANTAFSMISTVIAVDDEQSAFGAFGGASVIGEASSMARFRKSSVSYEGETAYHLFSPASVDQFGNIPTRLSKMNHPKPGPGLDHVHVCNSYYCDAPGLQCVNQGTHMNEVFVC